MVAIEKSPRRQAAVVLLVGSQGDSDLVENEKKSTYTTSSLLQVKEEKGMSLRVIRPILHKRTILSILLP